MAHDVFVSHSSKDKPTADAVCAMLESQGIRCWVAPRDILPGREWGASIIEAIKGAKTMVLIFSSHTNSSPQINREVERAVNRGIPIIPLRIENVLPTESLEYFLSSPHWMDAFTPPLERHLQQLAPIVRQIIGAPVTEGLPSPTAEHELCEQAGGAARLAEQKRKAAEAEDAALLAKKKAESITPAPVAKPPPPPATMRKSRLAGFAMAVAAIVLLGLGAWYFGSYLPEREREQTASRLAAEQAARDQAQAAASRLAAEQAAHDHAQTAVSQLTTEQAVRDPAQTTALRLVNKGNILYQSGRYGEAMQSFDQALEIDPKFAHAWYGKAVTDDALRHPSEAIQNYRKFIELTPPSQDAKLVATARNRLSRLGWRGSLP